MKKILALIAALAIVLTIGIAVSAEENIVFTITPSKQSVVRNETVDFTVTVSGKAERTILGFAIDLKGAPFELVGAKAEDVPGMDSRPSEEENLQYKGCTMIFTRPSTYEGKYFTFTLKAKEDAKLSQYSISGEGTAINGSKRITAKVISTDITVSCNHTFGPWEVAEDGTHQRVCSKCGTVEKHTPKYDNDCDPDCNICGLKREVHHKYKTDWSSDKTGHWHECSCCGKKKDFEKHTPGPAATVDHPQVCTKCGYVIAPRLEHQHTFDDTWHYDENAHWHVCTQKGCHAKADYHKHVYDDECDVTCNICGYVRKAPHKPSEEWRGDATGHWHACLNCGAKLDFMPHEPGPEATWDTPQVCTVCGYIIKPALKDHVHNFDGEWQTSDTEHWHQCECGEIADKAPHTWDEGVVTKEPGPGIEGEKTFTCTVCGKTRTETIPALPDNPATDPQSGGEETPPDGSGGMSAKWWIVAAAAVILGGGGIALIVIAVIRIQKNRHGKFSS